MKFGRMTIMSRFDRYEDLIDEIKKDPDSLDELVDHLTEDEDALLRVVEYQRESMISDLPYELVTLLTEKFERDGDGVYEFSNATHYYHLFDQ